MKLHINMDLWEIKQLRDLRGADFSMAAKFVELKPGRIFVFSLASEDNEIWQVGKNEFVLLSGDEMLHTCMSHGKADSGKTYGGRKYRQGAEDYDRVKVIPAKAVLRCLCAS